MLRQRHRLLGVAEGDKGLAAERRERGKDGTPRRLGDRTPIKQARHRIPAMAKPDAMG